MYFKKKIVVCEISGSWTTVIGARMHLNTRQCMCACNDNITRHSQKWLELHQDFRKGAFADILRKCLTVYWTCNEIAVQKCQTMVWDNKFQHHIICPSESTDKLFLHCNAPLSLYLCCNSRDKRYQDCLFMILVSESRVQYETGNEA